MPILGPNGESISLPPRPPVTPRPTARERDLQLMLEGSNVTPGYILNAFAQANIGNMWWQAALGLTMEERDLELSAVLQTRKIAAATAAYHIDQTSESPRDQEVADFVREFMESPGLDISQIGMGILDALLYGYSVQFIHWDVGRSRVVPARVEWVPPWRIAFGSGRTGTDRAIDEEPRLLTGPYSRASAAVEIPRFARIYARNTFRSGFAQRNGLLRPTVLLFLLKNFAIKDWATASERFAQPRPYVTVEESQSIEAIKDETLKALYDLAGGTGGIFPPGTQPGLLEAGLSSQGRESMQEAEIRWIDQAYERGWLGQTATSQGTPGKLGAESAQNLVRQDIKEADQAYIARTLRYQMIWPAVGFTFGWDVPLPMVTFDPEQPADRLARIQGDVTLGKAGLPLSRRALRHQYGVTSPVNSEDELHVMPGLRDETIAKP